MSSYGPDRIGEIIAEMSRDGSTIKDKAAELGVNESTLGTGIRRFKKSRKKPGPKPGAKRPAVEVVDLRAPKTRYMTLGDRLARIESDVAEIRRALS